MSAETQSGSSRGNLSLSSRSIGLTTTSPLSAVNMTAFNQPPPATDRLAERREISAEIGTLFDSFIQKLDRFCELLCEAERLNRIERDQRQIRMNLEALQHVSAASPSAPARFGRLLKAIHIAGHRRRILHRIDRSAVLAVSAYSASSASSFPSSASPVYAFVLGAFLACIPANATSCSTTLLHHIYIVWREKEPRVWLDHG